MPPSPRPQLYERASMHEYVPEPRYVSQNASYGDDDEDYDYDVYLLYPSRNELILPAPFEVWDDESGSESTTSEHSVITSPTYSVDPSFSFTDTVNDADISSMGYSSFFRTGLWAQSARITRTLDMLIERTVLRLSAFKRHFARQASPADL